MIFHSIDDTLGLARVINNELYSIADSSLSTFGQLYPYPDNYTPLLLPPSTTVFPLLLDRVVLQTHRARPPRTSLIPPPPSHLAGAPRVLARAENSSDLDIAAIEFAPHTLMPINRSGTTEFHLQQAHLPSQPYPCRCLGEVEEETGGEEYTEKGGGGGGKLQS